MAQATIELTLDCTLRKIEREIEAAMPGAKVTHVMRNGEASADLYIAVGPIVDVPYIHYSMGKDHRELRLSILFSSPERMYLVSFTIGTCGRDGLYILMPTSKNNDPEPPNMLKPLNDLGFSTYLKEVSVFNVKYRMIVIKINVKQGQEQCK